MRNSVGIRSLVVTAVAALLLTVASSSVTMAQGKGHGRGQGNGNGTWSNRSDRDRSNSIWRNTTGHNRNYDRHYNKKCGKFVNCHDARDGRIDGRGPRGTNVSNVISRNRYRTRYNTNSWRYRNRRAVRRVYER
ncbi:MAG TPA: hypothetical protein VHR36_07495 [Pyrinomonadaceae bacterium]|jgi:hypothetical protein|nr:hypothetical protein [Pyrinomonadaceae bacterium]